MEAAPYKREQRLTTMRPKQPPAAPEVEALVPKILLCSNLQVAQGVS